MCFHVFAFGIPVWHEYRICVWYSRSWRYIMEMTNAWWEAIYLVWAWIRLYMSNNRRRLYNALFLILRSLTLLQTGLEHHYTHWCEFTNMVYCFKTRNFCAAQPWIELMSYRLAWLNERRVCLSCPSQYEYRLPCFGNVDVGCTVLPSNQLEYELGFPWLCDK